MFYYLVQPSRKGITAPSLIGCGSDSLSALKDAKSKSRLGDFPSWKFSILKQLN